MSNEYLEWAKESRMEARDFIVKHNNDQRLICFMHQFQEDKYSLTLEQKYDRVYKLMHSYYPEYEYLVSFLVEEMEV